MNININEPADLSCLPAVDEILRLDSIESLATDTPRVHLANWTRDAVDYYRQKLLDGMSISKDELLSAIARRIADRHQSDALQSMQRVVNATGVLLHTNLGRAPLSRRAVARMQEAVGYTNLEMDLTTGKRSRRGARASELLSELTGAEDAIVVNNCAAATVLVLQATAAGQEVIVSRGQLVEIGGGFRLPEVFKAAGVRLREVGTTNRTYLRDYEHAIDEETGAIIRVHRSNFAQSGFVTEPTIGELVTVERPRHVPVIDDIGSGLAVDLSKDIAQINEPDVCQSVASGANLSLFSGDKLFGGPQCGIIVGQSKWIDQLRSSPMMRALRTDKLTLAALEATVEIHLSKRAFDELPFYQMIRKDAEQIRQECETIANTLSVGEQYEVSVVEAQSQIGGGSMPGVELPSWCVCIKSSSSENLADCLRRSTPAVQCRQSDDSVLLDLRTVMPDEVEILVNALKQCLV